MRQILFLLFIYFGFSPPSKAFELSFNIKGTSIEELMNLKITSLSKKQENLNQATAAVYVLTNDEIQRLGVNHIAEALRYVPGVEVAQIDASRWAISIRGFNGRAANKLLVMIDGRSIYSPLFSGVLWEEKDVMLQDVDRIEVIRGPGTTVWGANAVNGVINIITKHSKDSQGAVVAFGSGNQQKALIQARYGWQIGDNSYMRTYFKHREQKSSNNHTLNDDNQHSQVGFRYDYQLSQQNNITIQGDLYDGEIGTFQPVDLPRGQRQSGGNLLFMWQFDDDSAGQHKLKSYYDQTKLALPTLTDRRKIADLEYQYQQQWRQHDIVAGLGVRLINDDVNFMPFNFISPRKSSKKLYQSFIQDEITISDKFHVTLGTKLEHNEYTGNELQPNVRLSYQAEQSFWWGAWSKAVRVPTRLEKDLEYPGFATDALDSENANFYELGWRSNWSNKFTLDVATYHGKYDQLLSIESYGYDNKLSGDTKGIEIASSYQLRPSWLLKANYSHANMSLSADSTSLSQTRAREIEGLLPNNMVQLSSLWDINEAWQLNAFVRYVGEIKTNNIKSYWSYDLSLQWQATKQISFAFSARHLGEHPEWQTSTKVEQDLFLTMKWQL